MKLKILPPTLRQKKRYITFDFYSEVNIKKEELMNLLWNNLINLYGEIEASRINLWVINIKKIDKPKHVCYRCLIKCKRGKEDEMLTSLDTISNYNKHRVVIHPLSTSGTIKSLDKKYDLL